MIRLEVIFSSPCWHLLRGLYFHLRCLSRGCLAVGHLFSFLDGIMPLPLRPGPLRFGRSPLPLLAPCARRWLRARDVLGASIEDAADAADAAELTLVILGGAGSSVFFGLSSPTTMHSATGDL